MRDMIKVLSEDSSSRSIWNGEKEKDGKPGSQKLSCGSDPVMRQQGLDWANGNRIKKEMA